MNQLAEGRDPEQVVVELANKLTNSLLHSPTKALKLAAQTQDEETLSLLIKALGIDSNKEC